MRMKDDDTLTAATSLRPVYTRHDLLHPWLLVRHLPNSQRQVIHRFRTRSEADEYQRVLQRLIPEADLEVVFDLPS